MTDKTEIEMPSIIYANYESATPDQFYSPFWTLDSHIEGSEKYIKASLAGTGSKSIQLVIRERQRQIDQEGWSEAHDDEHDNGELADAAACYAMGYQGRNWPFAEPMKTHSEKRRLVIAAALLLAELDRLDRADK